MAEACFYGFDLLWLDGQDLRPLGLMHRKRVLRHVLNENKIGSLLYADFAEENGVGLYKAVCIRDLAANQELPRKISKISKAFSALIAAAVNQASAATHQEAS